MSKLQFRLAARTDAAGKYNPNAPLEGNEDNMFVDSNLNNDVQGRFMADEVVNLSERGCLMVVADGMGGMNAGEVASDIAIKTVTEYFSPQRLSGKTFRDSRARCKYMEEVVEAADANIKNDARTNKEHEGMGSTIIMGWLCDDEICLTWCGDSRAYLYRPGRGFWQVSKDHSYVQGLVDDGKITPEEAFDHPYGNIITRSLGDPEKKAKADSKVFPVFEGDIFMLCSDGLSGVLRDHKTYVDGQRIESENLEDLIADNRNSMAQCRDELFAAAERNDWYDNVTAILCEIVSGKPLPADMVDPPVCYPTPKASVTPEPSTDLGGGMSNTSFRIRKRSLPLLIAALVLLLGAVGFLVYLITRGNNPPSGDSEYFAYCESKQEINCYRNYVNRFPNGLYINDAKSWIKQWVADSTAKANGLAKTNDPQPDDKPNPTNKKGKEEPKKEPKKTETKQAPDNTGEQGESPKGNDGDNTPQTPKLVDSRDGLATPGGIVSAESTGKPGLKPSESGNSVGGGLSASGDNAEERLYNEVSQKIKNNTATIEDCKKYLRKYYKTGNGANAEHWQVVAGRFKLLYVKKIQSCKTVAEFDEILNNHDALMKELHLNGMPEYDSNTKALANTLKKKLNEPQTKGNGVINEGDPRPTTGTASFKASKPKTK